MPPQPGFPNPDPGDKKFNDHPATPTVLRNKPLSENVEGLFAQTSRLFRKSSQSSIRSDPEQVSLSVWRKSRVLLIFDSSNGMAVNGYEKP